MQRLVLMYYSSPHFNAMAIPETPFLKITYQLFYYVAVLHRLQQRCPTLSPFATCGDRLFKCDDKTFFLKRKSLVYCSFYTIFLLNVATAKTPSPQKWRQEHFDWTAVVVYTLSLHVIMAYVLDQKKSKVYYYIRVLQLNISIIFCSTTDEVKTTAPSVSTM